MFIQSQQLRNTIYLSACFTVIFVAFNGLGNIQKTLLISIKKEDPNYDGDGYVCYGIIYSVMGLSIWCVPSTIAKFGTKCCLIIGAILYGTYTVSYFFEIGYLIYIGSVLLGLGASLLWTAQANYIVSNCNIGEVPKGIGLFWMFYQSSFIPGNLFIYFEFHNVKHVDRGSRNFILSVLLGINVIALIMVCFIKPPLRTEQSTESKGTKSSAFDELKKSLIYAKSNNMLLLFSTIAYTGLHLTFLSILSASIGFSKYLSTNSKELVPLSGVFHGIGSVAGGLVPLYFSGKDKKYWRPIFSVGAAVNIITYIIAYISLPNSAAFGYTDELPIRPMNFGCLLLISFLAGCGDCCLHTQLYSELGALYPNDSAPVFAVFKFFRNIFTATSFYYSNYLGLHVQLIILTTWLFLSTVTYHIMLRVPKSLTSQDQSIGVHPTSRDYGATIEQIEKN